PEHDEPRDRAVGPLYHAAEVGEQFSERVGPGHDLFVAGLLLPARQLHRARAGPRVVVALPGPSRLARQLLPLDTAPQRQSLVEVRDGRSPDQQLQTGAVDFFPPPPGAARAVLLVKLPEEVV